MTFKEIKGIFILIVFASITALMFNRLSPNGIALFGQWEVKNGVISANEKTNSLDSSIEIHSSEIVWQIVQTKQRIVLDVRTREEYDQGHIPSALSFPLIEFDEIIEDLLSKVKPQEPILIYCSSIQCADSRTFADHLKNMGYTQIKVFSGGFSQWKDEGFGIDK